MGKAARMPLEERLRRAGPGILSFPAVFEVFFDDYFSTLSQMCGSPYYETLYTTCLSRFTPPRGFCMLPEAVAGAAEEEGEKHSDLLFRILAEPFGDALWAGEKEGGKKDGTIHEDTMHPA